MKTLNKKRLVEHANINIDKIFQILDIDHIRRGDLVQSSCPCKQHPGDGDNPTAFSWRDSSSHWVCWSHHCEQEYGSDILGLIRSVVGCSFNDSLKWISEFLVKNSIDIDSEPVIQKSKNRVQIKSHEPLSENLLKFLEPKYDLLLARGYQPQTMTDYEIGFWNRLGTFMHNRIIVPIRDINDNLVGFSGRTIYEKSDWEKYQIKAKWVHGRYYDRWPKIDELKTGSLLFNLNKAKNYIGLQKTIILVEGPLDGLRLHEAGINNWIALLGCNFTPIHRNILVSLGINNLVLALDTDQAGVGAANKLSDSLSDFFHIHRPRMQNDPSKTSLQELRDIFNDYQKC